MIPEPNTYNQDHIERAKELLEAWLNGNKSWVIGEMQKSPALAFTFGVHLAYYDIETAMDARKLAALDEEIRRGS